MCSAELGAQKSLLLPNEVLPEVGSPVTPIIRLAGEPWTLQIMAEHGGSVPGMGVTAL